VSANLPQNREEAPVPEGRSGVGGAPDVGGAPNATNSLVSSENNPKFKRSSLVDVKKMRVPSPSIHNFKPVNREVPMSPLVSVWSKLGVGGSSKNLPNAVAVVPAEEGEKGFSTPVDEGTVAERQEEGSGEGVFEASSRVETPAILKSHLAHLKGYTPPPRIPWKLKLFLKLFTLLLILITGFKFTRKKFVGRDRDVEMEL